MREIPLEREAFLTFGPLFPKYKIHIFYQQFISWGPPPGMGGLVRKLIPGRDVPAESPPKWHSEASKKDFLARTSLVREFAEV